MLKLYGEKRINRIMDGCGEWIKSIEERFGLPSAALKAVLRQELSQIDLIDLAADQAVIAYWRFYRLLGRAPRFGKRDSSTGYTQVFAATAIDSLNFAFDRQLTDARSLGLFIDHKLQKTNPSDLHMIWQMLHRDRFFNLLCAALTLIAAADEMNGTTDFSRYTPLQWQLTFSRYNADTRRITRYGQQAYSGYQSYL